MRRAFIAALVVGVMFALVPAAAAAPPAHAGKPSVTPPTHAGTHLSAVVNTQTAHLWLNQGRGQVCVEVAWPGLLAAPSQAQIKKGTVVVTTIALTATTGPNRLLKGCNRAVDKWDVKEIRQNPGAFKLHVSSWDGQLSK